MNKINLLVTTLILATFTGITACDKKSSNSGASTSTNTTPTTTVPGRYIYVASGACYGGGVTTSAASSTVVRYNLSSGTFDSMVIDYNTASPGDNPASIIDYDADHLLVLVENASGRRIDIVKKDGSGYSSYLTNSTALSAVMRNLIRMPDGSMLVSKSSAVEKFSAGKSRVTVGANPYINAPGSSCATSTTLISSLAGLSNGKIVFTHAAATPNNKFGIISSTGYSSTSDCLAAQTAPNTTALPSAVIRHSSGDLLVAYGSTTLTSNFIYGYGLDETTNVISSPTAAYTDNGVINGPSAMAEDTSTADVYVANATSTFNTIEKFTYNQSTKTLTKSTTTPFIPMSIFTKCVSGLLITN